MTRLSVLLLIGCGAHPPVDIVAPSVIVSPDLGRPVPNGTSISSAGVKWHPGHYALSNNNLEASARVDGIESEIDTTFAASSNIAGFMIRVYWGVVETDKDVYDFSGIDVLRAYVATRYPDKRFGIRMQTEIPGSGYYTVNDGGGVTAAYWRPAVAQRIEAPFAALAKHASPLGAFAYDTDPYVEAIAWDGESSCGVPDSGDSTWSVSAYQEQWAAIQASRVQSWPHTNQLSELNYTNTSPESGGSNGTAQMMVTDIGNGLAMSGPDLRPTYYGGYTDGQFDYTGQLPSLPHQFGTAAYIAMVDGPDTSPRYANADGSNGPTTASQVAQYALNSWSDSPAGLNAPEMWWDVWTADVPGDDTGDWRTDIVPNGIDAHPIPDANKSCPSNYATRGGCNTD